MYGLRAYDLRGLLMEWPFLFCEDNFLRSVKNRIPPSVASHPFGHWKGPYLFVLLAWIANSTEICLMPRMRRFTALIFVLALFAGNLNAQSPILDRVNFVQVVENGLNMSFPFAGGFDQPQFNEFDLDGDGTMDLIAFDRAGYEPIPFLNGGAANTVDYTFAPEYENVFPDDLAHYAVYVDFNCDGKTDIFTSNGDLVRVYENVTSGSNIAFSVYADTLMTDLGAGPAPLVVSTFDVPGFADIDNDGDIDILTFDPGGNFLEYHKNMAMENNGNCSGMEFIRAESCWGKFQESALGSSISLNVSCRVGAPGSNPQDVQTGSVHAGSTVAIFDQDGDGIKDIVLGDLTSNTMTYLHNGGTISNAVIDTAHTNYPSYDTPVEIDNFPGAYFLDVNNDGKEDMIASPNSSAATFNFKNVWYYQNVGTNGEVLISQNSTRFLQKDMIDLGTCSYPTFFDYNNDGLLDLLVGNYNTKTQPGTGNAESGLALFINTGTATMPSFELDTRDFEGLSSIFGTTYGFTPTLGDLDNDGDKDLIVGDADGKLHYFENIAPSGQNADFVLAQGDYKGIDIGNFATPSLADIDRDGKLDLVVGEMGGTLNYFRNTGTAMVADFNSSPDDNNWGGIDVEPTCCVGWSVPTVVENPATGNLDLYVGSESANIWYYEDFESELGGNFTLDDSAFGNIKEGFRTSIAIGDLNGDNKPEYITGNLRGGLGFYAEQGTFVGSATARPVKPLFDIYPNPSSGELRLTSQVRPGSEMQIQIVDIQGRQVHGEKVIFPGGAIDLQTPSLSPGMYFVRVISENTAIGSRKWVVK